MADEYELRKDLQVNNLIVKTRHVSPNKLTVMRLHLLNTFENLQLLIIFLTFLITVF